jgi:hypothetical protein
MSHGNRLGKDPLSRDGASSAASGRQALRHILDLGLDAPNAEPACEPASPPMDAPVNVPVGAPADESANNALSAAAIEPVDERVDASVSAAISAPGDTTGSAPESHPEQAPDRGAIYREVAGKFSEAMDILSRLAAQAGVWAWGTHAGESGEGDSLLFMRLMAAYAVLPGREGVDVEAFLNDVRDHWGECSLSLSLNLGGALLPLERAFTLARALQASLDGFCRPGKHGAALLNLDASFTRQGSLKLRLHGYRDYFPARESVFEAPGAESLVELARQEGVSLLFICTEETAELAVIV